MSRETVELAKQKSIDLGTTTGIDEMVIRWTEYTIQFLSLDAWHDLRVTLDLAQAQAWKVDFEANQLGHEYRIVEKDCVVHD